MPLTLPYPLDVVFLILAVVFGVCIGSFANVLSYRIPRGIPFAKGFSFCPACGKRVAPHDLIPVVSYIFLGGKCRSCRAPISFQYPLVEILGGLLAAVTVWKYGCGLAAAACFAVFIVLLVIAFVDAEHMVIPNGLVVALAVCGAGYAAVTWGDATLLSRAIGFFVLSVPMLALALLIEGAFGGGDVKLSAVCGFLLGLRLTLLAGLVAVLLGGGRAVYVKFIRRGDRPTHISFGQYICAGVFVAVTAGESLLEWYLGIFGL